VEMINDILDISRIESGQLELKLTICNLGSLMEEAEGYALAIRTRKKRDEVTFSLQIDEVFRNQSITIDRQKWRQIIHNLVGNAFKFTLQGRVEIGCKPGEKGVPLFYVLDTGVGIPASKQSVIFDRFVQLHYGHPEFGSGTGLGLSIVKGLIELFEGAIWLESEPRKGTIIYFSFPEKYFRLS
ncbi:MAG: sensor histidine kinase, partial [Bacteroidales bacterium]